MISLKLPRTRSLSFELSIRAESPRQRDVVRLLAALDAYLEGLYPPQSNHILDIDALCAADVRFFVARRGDRALGCGALRIDRPDYGEIKRMYVDPAVRGRRIGRALLARIEIEATDLELPVVRLETGIRQSEALALFRSAGYAERGPFGAYGPDPLSVFMEKAVDRALYRPR